MFDPHSLGGPHLRATRLQEPIPTKEAVKNSGAQCAGGFEKWAGYHVSEFEHVVSTVAARQQHHMSMPHQAMGDVITQATGHATHCGPSSLLVLGRWWLHKGSDSQISDGQEDGQAWSCPLTDPPLY